MKQLSLLKDRVDELQEKFLELTNNVLPSLAEKDNWPVVHNHCFQRIILDNLFGECWYNHLISGIPTYLQLNREQLEQAISIASRIQCYGLPYLNALNLNSLSWRGKI